MHRILHGISRVLPTACEGLLDCSCLPFLAWLNSDSRHDSADHDLLQPELEGQDRGDLPPLRGEDYQQEVSSLADQADNVDLQLQPQEGPNTGDLLRHGDEAEIYLQPHLQGGHEEEKAELNLQQQPHNGPTKGELLPTKGDDETANKLGHLSPMKGQEIVPPANKKYEDAGANFNILQQDDMMEMSYAWDLPMPRPRVKMKEEVDIFYLITGMLDPGICIAALGTHAWHHNVWEPFASLPHHDLLVMSLQPTSSTLVHYQSSRAACSCEGIFHFSHLRGRSSSKQAQEMKIAVAVMVKVFCVAKEADRRRLTTKMFADRASTSWHV